MTQTYTAISQHSAWTLSLLYTSSPTASMVQYHFEIGSRKGNWFIYSFIQQKFTESLFWTRNTEGTGIVQ